MKMHKFATIEDVNRALAEFEEDNTVFIKSVKTLSIKDHETFFVLTDFKGPNKANYYYPRTDQNSYLGRK